MFRDGKIPGTMTGPQFVELHPEFKKYSINSVKTFFNKMKNEMLSRGDIETKSKTGPPGKRLFYRTIYQTLVTNKVPFPFTVMAEQDMGTPKQSKFAKQLKKDKAVENNCDSPEVMGRLDTTVWMPAFVQSECKMTEIDPYS